MDNKICQGVFSDSVVNLIFSEEAEVLTYGADDAQDVEKVMIQPVHGALEAGKCDLFFFFAFAGCWGYWMPQVSEGALGGSEWCHFSSYANVVSIFCVPFFIP